MSYRRVKIPVGLAFTLPALIALAFIYFLPIFLGLYQSLTNENLLRETIEFIGLGNYFRLFADSEFFRALRNSTIWTFSSVTLQAIIGLGIAILLNQNFRGRTLMRIAILLPWTTPVIVVCVLWSWLLAEPFGIINYTLTSLGIIGASVPWLASKTYSLWITAIVWTWISFPVFMMAILAALQSVPPELYDAAKVDGANWFRIFRAVTFPHILPVFGVMYALKVIMSFNHFSTVFFLTGGGPAGSTETIPIFVFKKFWLEYDAGFAAATSMVGMGLMFIVWSIYSSVRVRVYEH